MVEIGNTNYWDSNHFSRKDHKLTWDIWGGLTVPRHGVKVVWEQFVQRSERKLASLTWVKTRFDLIKNNLNKGWHYADFCLVHEAYPPHIEAKYGTSLKMITWEHEGSATLGGVSIKMIKPWMIEVKGLAWNQSWWDDVKTNNRYSDPLVIEWSQWHYTRLLRAWREHLHSFGRGAAFIGIGFLCGTGYRCFKSDFESKFQTGAMRTEIFKYDIVKGIQYPRSMAEVQNSVDMAKTVREYYGYNGIFIMALTSSFKASWAWDWNEAVAWAEFQAIAPYVDVIVTFELAKDSSPQILYPQYLIKFFDQYTRTQPQPTMYNIHILNASGGGCVKLNDKDLYCGSDVGLQEPAGSQFKLEAVPNNGYVFDHWILNGLTYNDPIVTGVMNANKEYEVYFKPAPGPDPEPQPAKPDLVKPIIIIIGGSILKELLS